MYYLSATFGALLLGVIVPALGRRSGAPDEACISMEPEHGGLPKTSPPPFEILTSEVQYTSGETMIGEELCLM